MAYFEYQAAKLSCKIYRNKLFLFLISLSPSFPSVPGWGSAALAMSNMACSPGSTIPGDLKMPSTGHTMHSIFQKLLTGAWLIINYRFNCCFDLVGTLFV
jgi:hypothetical protein